MKINWKVRIKNPYFWVGLLGVILSAMGRYVYQLGYCHRPGKGVN